MCGIAGVVSNKKRELRSIVVPMIDAQRHRGPDDFGVWSDDNCALGHRRLAIIDLSEAGRNPLPSIDRDLWITFNGEIYNYQELRVELEKAGLQFRTRTDTEVIVNAYRKWGLDCVSRLRGMFAFALWDSSRKRLFIARDRVGKKPLFYTTVNGVFRFASELQGLVSDPQVAREADPEALDAYLSWGYIPAPSSGFRNVLKLPPAHWMTIEVQESGLETHVERYWRLKYDSKLNLTEAEAREALREKLTEAVRLRMISDVPLGAFLSGGIDSSIVVGLMAGLSERPVKTFSIGFSEEAWDETAHARRIAEKWGTEHHEFRVEPDALEILPTLVRHYGEPYADSSAVPTFYLSKMTRESVTVALNGDGGDESFAGYERYFANRLAERIRSVPGSGASAALLTRILPDSINPKSRLRNLKRFLSVASEPMASRYPGWLTFFNGEAKRDLYTAEFASALDVTGNWMERLFEGTKDLDPVEAAMSVDIDSYLPYDLLVKVDITSMANSLEARSPFLDHVVMEFAASLPASLKLKGSSLKSLLKSSFSDLLPAENVNRRKMGFGVPVGEWFRGSLRGLLKDTLLSDQAKNRGYFNSDVTRRMFDEHVNGRADHAFKLWNLLMLELWQREFIDSRNPVQAFKGDVLETVCA